MSFFSKGLFGSTNSGSSSRPSRSPSRSPVSPPNYLGPGSSKRDYTFGLNPSTSTTSRGHAQSFYDASGDKPPPYDPNFGSSSADMPGPHKASSATHIHTDSNGEAPLKILESYDVVIILDDSNSMTAVDRKTGRTRWNEALDALAALVRAGNRYAKDGIEIHFLNKREAGRIVRNEAEFQQLRREIQQPDAETYSPIADVLDEHLRKYMNKLSDAPPGTKVKGRNFIVITDGAPTDAPEDVIVAAAAFLQKNNFPIVQAGIQFVQVGNDPRATEFLEGLDTDLVELMETQYARDIVDTVMSNGRDLVGDTLVKALTGAINRRQDRMGEKGRKLR